MLLCTFDIILATYRLAYFESVEIKTAVDQLASTATISLPGLVSGIPTQLEGKIKRGDNAVISLGYDGDNNTEFAGYIRAIYPNATYKIELEDAVFLTRRKIKDKLFKKTTVPAILKYVVDELNKQLPDYQKLKFESDLTGYQYEKFLIKSASGFDVLTKLKQETSLGIYFRGQTLHCHLLYSERRSQVVYDVERNMQEGGDLQYMVKEDQKVQIRVIGKTKDNASVEAFAGEPGGDVKTFNRPDISDKATLELLAKEQLKRLSYDGYKGRIKTWLAPLVEVGSTAQIRDADYPERQGTFYVPSVTTRGNSTEGFVRDVELGFRVL